MLRGARSIVEECYKWSVQREVFGEKLIEKPVIRAKLARWHLGIRTSGARRSAVCLLQ